MSDIEHGDDMATGAPEIQALDVKDTDGVERVSVRRTSIMSKKSRYSLAKRLLISLVAMLVAIIFFVVVALTVSRDNKDTLGQNPPVTGRFENGAVAADVGLCSEMGRDILKQGGSAVDAAITTLLCVGVVNPQSSGLGGGMFMLVHSPTNGKTEALMARERAPLAATSNMNLQKFGGTSIAVPGELSGMWEAHSRYGILPWQDLFKPVIQLAQDGFEVTKHLANALQVLTRSTPDIKSQPMADPLVAKYTRPDGSWKEAGDIVHAPKMAKTLQAIATNGISELQTGETAQGLIQDVQDNGGIITLEDLASYKAEWKDALYFPLDDQGMTVATTPSPSGGPIIEFILNILQNYNLKEVDFKTDAGKIQIYHRFLEASKFAFALRSYLGDVDTPEVTEVLAKLQSKEFARTISKQIRDDEVTFTNATEYGALVNTAIRDGGTCHINVVDQDGNAVSATSSVNYYFGSRIMSNRTGLILNNEMGDFDTPASQPASTANHITPGKIPLSAMSPVIVLNRNAQAELVIGSAGSRAIITTNAWVILRSFFSTASLKDIIDEKRIHNQLQPNIVKYEDGLPTELLESLIDMGHEVQGRKFISILQAIRRMDDGWMAYSDPRKHGYAAGY